MFVRIVLLSSFAVMCSINTSVAQEEPPVRVMGENQEILASQGGVSITHAEFDAAVSKIPSDIRLAFVRDGERVDQLIRSLLRSRMLSEAAREDGYAGEDLVTLRLELAQEQELANMWLQKRLEYMVDVDYDLLAREYFLANKEKFQLAPTVGASHILISSENKPVEEAQALADSIKMELDADPTLFDGFITEYSEDPSKVANFGHFKRINPGQMVTEFEDQLFSMTEVGSISEPVKTSYGFHIIRLNQYVPGRQQTYEEVAPQVLSEVRTQYQDKSQRDYLRSLVNQELVVDRGQVEEMVKRYFGDDLSAADLVPPQ